MNERVCPAKHICLIIENKKSGYRKLKELRKTLKPQKYPSIAFDKGIKKVLAILLEQHRREKLKCNNDIVVPFMSN